MVDNLARTVGRYLRCARDSSREQQQQRPDGASEQRIRQAQKGSYVWLLGFAAFGFGQVSLGTGAHRGVQEARPILFLQICKESALALGTLWS